MPTENTWYYDCLAGCLFPDHAENQEKEAHLLSLSKVSLQARKMEKKLTANATRTLKDKSSDSSLMELLLKSSEFNWASGL